MSLEDARKILGMDSSTSLDKAYKKAAMKHHPDRGGSDEMMKKVNQAYSLLKASGGGKTYSQMSDDERKAAWQARKEEEEKKKEENKKRMETMLTDFSDRFMQAVPAYNDHFKEFFTLEQPEIKTGVVPYWSYNFYGKLLIKWPTKDASTYISLIIEIRPEQSKGLGFSGSESEYDVDFRTILYHNRKDHKLSNRRWSWNKTSKSTLDPEQVFPKAKLKKIVAKTGTGKMTRKDFQLAISVELKKYNPNYKFRDMIVFDFDRPDGFVISLSRNVFNRVPYWLVNVKHINAAKNLITYSREAVEKFGTSHWTMPETSKALDTLKDFLNKFIKNEKIDKEFFKAAYD